MFLDMLRQQFDYNHYSLEANTAGLSHDDSLIAAPGGGNCLNWVVGHIMVARNAIGGRLLGGEYLWGKDEIRIYERGSEPLTDPGRALPLERILADIDAVQATIRERLPILSAERLAEAAPFSPAGREDETVASLLAMLAFHEAYHVGQTALLRRLAGRGGAIA